MVMTFVQYPFGIFQLVDQNRKRGWKESELTVCLTNTGQLTRKERRYFRSCLPNQPERINWIVHVSGRASKASENLNDRFDSASDLVIRLYLSIVFYRFHIIFAITRKCHTFNIFSHEIIT